MTFIKNKYLISGVILILFAGILFVTDIFTPYIRPITYIFLMGSSKGKDILFFALLGLFLILTQLHKLKIFDKLKSTKKILQILLILSVILFISEIILEINLRWQLGLDLSTTFISMQPSMSSTSILHTHLLKSIFGGFLTTVIGPLIQSDINTGISLYSYTPQIANLLMILLIAIFILQVVAIQRKAAVSKIMLCFFSVCLLIGFLDGGLFSTPAAVGLLGTYLVYRNGYYFDFYIGKLLKNEKIINEAKKNPPSYRNKEYSYKRFVFNRLAPYIVIFLFLALRFSVSLLGANPEYYEVNIVDIQDDALNLTNIPIESVTKENNNITYHVSSAMNEQDVINELKIPLKDNCKYYTVSWNVYSYL